MATLAAREAFGLTSSVKNLEWIAIASQVRVANFDKGIASVRTLGKDCVQIRSAMDNTNWPDRRIKWRDWYDRCFLFRLQSSNELLKQRAGGLENLRLTRFNEYRSPEEDGTWRSECQKSVYSFFSGGKHAESGK